MTTPLFISDSLQLAPLTQADAEPLLALIDSNRQSLETYLYWAATTQTLEDVRGYIQARVESQEPESRWYRILLEGELVGVFGIKRISRQLSIAEVGYWLGQSARGQRLIDQIILFLSKEFAQQSIHQIEIRCLQNNHASIAVAERLGARLYAQQVDFLLLDTCPQNLQIYHISTSDLSGVQHSVRNRLDETDQ